MSFDNVNVNVCGGQSIIKALQNYNTVILKPNIVDNRNVLTQEMMSERHTKYVIRWNYSLEGATINVPEDCIIEFAGGTIDNGTIVGDNTIMIYNKPINEVCPAERQGTFIYNTTVADEEDITSESGQLKFKDRPATDGMGRKILRKNIVDGVNTLTQSMMQATNTIYVIQYDFDLGGASVTVPANCVLEFDGGSLRNGSIGGNETEIEAGSRCVFDNIILTGTLTKDLVLNNFKHANDCVVSRENTGMSIHVIGTCIIDEPLIVREHFQIYGDSSDSSKIELDQNYNGEIKAIFIFDNADGEIGWTSFRDFKVTDVDYVFYRNCGSRASSTGSIFLTTYENLYFENISKSLFYVKCYGFSTAKINNIFVGGQCNNEGEALMWFDVYYFNYNIISGSNFSGLVVNKLLYVYTSDNAGTYGELNLNSILNSRFENIILRSSNTEGCLIHLNSVHLLNTFNIDGNYIERIYKGSPSGEFGTVFRFTIGADKIVRGININNNYLNSAFENFIYFDADVVRMTLIDNGPQGTQNIISSRSQILEVGLIGNSSSFNIVATNVTKYSLGEEPEKIKDFNGKFYSIYYAKTIAANGHEDIKIIPNNYNRSIYYSDVQITYGTRKLITGKVTSTDGINFGFTKTFGDTDVITTQLIDLNGNLRINNISSGVVEVRVGIFIATL